MTNAHVVTTDAIATVTGRPQLHVQLRVQLHDGDAYEAVVRHVDRKADIATIKVNPQVRAYKLSTGTLSLDHILITFSTLLSSSKSKYVIVQKHSELLHNNPHPDTCP